jgi:hypothetical protein
MSKICLAMDRVTALAALNISYHRLLTQKL